MCEECGVEKWRDIPGYEGYYQQSNWGRTKSVARIAEGTDRKRIRERVLKPGLTTQRRNRWNVSLYKNKKCQSHRSSILTLTIFGPPQPPGTECCHGPRGSLVDCISNLEWGTKSKNNGPDKLRDGTDPRGEKQGAHKLTETQVLEIVELITAGEAYPSIAGKYGVKPGTVAHIARGERWQWLTGIKPGKRKRRGYYDHESKC